MTGTRAQELTRAWAVLTAPRVAELSSYPLALAAAGAHCRVALDRDGRRHLLVPAPQEELTTDPRPSVLTSVVRTLAFDGSTVVHVDICCTDPDLDPEFDDVVSDLLDSVDGSPSPGAAALAGLARWRRLFRSRLERGLGAAVRLGLFAELSVLRSLLSHSTPPTIEVWTGPLGRPHDFEASSGCLEVKATGPDTDTIRINGLDQLDTHDGRSLELVIVTVVPDPDGTTLADLVGTVTTMLDDPTGLVRRLTRLGWSAGDRTDDEPLTVADVARIPVDAATPRLVPGSLTSGELPMGIATLNYDVQLDELLKRRIPGGLTEAVESVSP